MCIRRTLPSGMIGPVTMQGEPTSALGAAASAVGAPPQRPVREPGLPIWLRRVLPAAVVAVVVVRTLTQLTDPDTLWHIRAGDLLLETGDFVQPDPWSPASTNPWVLHQWLPEVVMALLHRAFGLPGVAWGFTLAVAVLGLTLWWVLRRRAGLLVTALVAVVTIVGMSASLSARPQIVSFILTVVVAHTWLRTAQDRRARWWLVAVSWLWACSHGLWVVGPALGLVVVAGMALDRSAPSRVLGRLALVPLASVGIAVVTPVGPALFTSFVEIRQVAPFLDEWQPTPPTHPAFIAVAVLVAIPVLAALRSVQRMSWVTILLLVLAIGSALVYGRTVAVGAAIAAPITAESLQRLVRLRRERIDRPEVAVTVLVVAAALAVTAVMAPRVAAEPGRGPAALSPALAALPAGTVVCNQDAVGGWLIWEHPDLRPTLDTRMEVYGAQHVQAYATFLGAKPGWQGYLTRTGCRVALLETNTPVVEALTAQLHWTELARADGYVLLRAPVAS